MTLTAPLAEQRAARLCSERLLVAIRSARLHGAEPDPERVIEAAGFEHYAHPAILRRLAAHLAAST